MDRSLSILLADDEEIIHQTLGGYLTDLGHHVEGVHDGLTALKSIGSGNYDLALVDVRMPGMDGLSLLDRMQKIRPETPVVIITGHGNMDMAIQALRLGAIDFLTKPVELLRLDAVLERFAQIYTLRRDKRRLQETIRDIQSTENFNRGLVGVSEATKKVREQIQQAINARCETILITGETGTGKEVVAREIHFRSSSEESPFIAVSCPALSESLLESELFGHVKGAFTGAMTDRAGHFELADGGTLFLDEIADLSPSAQAKLLRVLETRAITRVGSSKEIGVNVRVISATNSYLEELVEGQKFRQDLFYRLNVYRIHLLPLRERREDILTLAEHFLHIYAVNRGFQFRGFSSAAKEALLKYDYPGNARELRNLVERAAILCGSGQIEAKNLSLPEYPEDKPKLYFTPSDDQERAHILSVLGEAKWNRRRAAQALDMPYSTLRYKIQKLGIS